MIFDGSTFWNIHNKKSITKLSFRDKLKFKEESKAASETSYPNGKFIKCL